MSHLKKKIVTVVLHFLFVSGTQDPRDYWFQVQFQFRGTIFPVNKTFSLLQETKKLFNFLGLRPSNSSGAFTFSRRVFGAAAGGGSRHSARIGPSRRRRSRTGHLVRLSAAPDGFVNVPFTSALLISIIFVGSAIGSAIGSTIGWVRLSTGAHWRSIRFTQHGMRPISCWCHALIMHWT